MKMGNASIKSKLTLINFFSIGLAITIMGMALYIYELKQHRAELLTDTISHARVIAQSSLSSIIFLDEKGPEKRSPPCATFPRSSKPLFIRKTAGF